MPKGSPRWVWNSPSRRLFSGTFRFRQTIGAFPNQSPLTLRILPFWEVVRLLGRTKFCACSQAPTLGLACGSFLPVSRSNNFENRALSASMRSPILRGCSSKAEQRLVRHLFWRPLVWEARGAPGFSFGTVAAALQSFDQSRQRSVTSKQGDLNEPWSSWKQGKYKKCHGPRRSFQTRTQSSWSPLDGPAAGRCRTHISTLDFDDEV